MWARDEGGRFGGFVLEDPEQLPGFTAKPMGGKIAKRAVHQAEITLEEVHIPAADRLANCSSFRDLTAVLANTRAGVAWEAVGLAAGCYEIALKYACERQQFGKPIASVSTDPGQTGRDGWRFGAVAAARLATGPDDGVRHRHFRSAVAGKANVRREKSTAGRGLWLARFSAATVSSSIIMLPGSSPMSRRPIHMRAPTR